VTEPSPKRLVDQDDRVGALLRRADEEFQHGLDANRALLRLQNERRPLLRGSWLWGASAVVVGLALLIARPWQRSNAAASLAAESLGSKPTAPPESGLSQPDDAVAIASALRAPPATREPARGGEARAVAGSQLPRPTPKPASSAEPELPTAPSVPEPDCLALARGGEPKAAAACFNERAAGSGLSAQVALYELSRLERDALGAPAQALVTLDRYLERFPNGSLNGEVRFSRLELLARLGRNQEALEASRAFLGSSFGVERAAEVHLLRGNLLLRQGQATAAGVEYRAALGAPGRVGDDATYQLAVALESAGDPPRARAAYERYLERPGGRHASAAKARLAQLSK
jgi:tetratricopeptide (TPR) repeat protein